MCSKKYHTWRDRGAKGPTKPETRRKPQRPEQIGGHAFIWRIALQPCFFLTEKLSGHSSLDSVGRAGLSASSCPCTGPEAPLSTPCRAMSECRAVCSGGSWMHSAFPPTTRSPGILQFHFMWAIEKNETPLHKVGKLLSKVLRLLKKSESLWTPLCL